MSDLVRRTLAGPMLVLTAWLSATALTGPAQAQVLVKDINTTLVSSKTGSAPGEFVSDGTNWTYFSADSATAGRELFRTDGSIVEMVVDLEPGADSSKPADLHWLGSRLVFRKSEGADKGLYAYHPASDSTQFLAASNSVLGAAEMGGYLYYFGDGGGYWGLELRRTNGTPAGTHLVKDINPMAGSSWAGHPIQVVGSTLYFMASDSVAGIEPWKSDGTAAGTVRLRDVRPGTGSSAVTREGHVSVGSAGSYFYFVADDGVSGAELWRSDTVAGAVKITDLLPGAAGPTFDIIGEHAGELYFWANTTGLSYSQVWLSDGSAAGTVMLGGGANGTYGPRPLVSIGSKALFLSTRQTSPTGFNECRLWETDGTPAGTKDVMSLGAQPYATLVPANNGKVYFGSLWGGGLDVTDGTAAGTQSLTGTAYQIGLSADGSSLLFMSRDSEHGEEPWITDGTVAGTRLLADIFVPLDYPNEGSDPFGFVDVYGRALFLIRHSYSSFALWGSDGTTAGTQILQYFGSSSASGIPPRITPFRGKALVAAGHGDRELYISDGTEVGTQLVKDIYPGPTHSDPSDFVVCGQRALFTAIAPDTGRQPWVTDGTTAGTMMLAEVFPGGSTRIGSTVRFGDRWLFIASEAGGDIELWSTDGTPGGSLSLGSIGPEAFPELPNRLVVTNDRVCFRNEDPVHGYELWASDGTAGGAVLLDDSRVGAVDGYPSEMTAAFGKVFYNCNDGVNGRELWVSDGTPSGTAMLKDIQPGGGHSYPTDFMPVGSDLLFFLADDGVHGRELWVTDGSAAGTVMLKDIRAGIEDPVLSDFVPVGTDRLFFWANDGIHGKELWVSDGTPAGTSMVKDIRPGEYAPIQNHMMATGSRRVVFSAHDGTDWGLWISDGTPAGTQVVSGFRPLSEPVLSNGQLLYAADDGLRGSEVWGYDPGATSKEVGVPSGLTLPRLRSSDALIGGSWDLAVESDLPSTFGYIALSGLAAPTSLFMPARLAPDHLIYLDLYVALASPLITVITDTDGDWHTSIPVPAGMTPSSTICIQGVLVNGTRWDLTNAVHFTIGN